MWNKTNNHAYRNNAAYASCRPLCCSKPIATLRHQAAFQQMYENFKPDVWITFAFNCDTTMDAAKRRLDEFHRRLDKAVFGRNWWKCADCRSPYLGVVENSDTNLHLHVGFRFPPDRVNVALARADAFWRKLVPSGNALAEAPYDLSGLADYNAKQLTPAKTDLILISDVGRLD